ncbi:MAG: CPBP family intramembrane metalloprotease [Oscillospiraceae bacterium]|nr:CPBP family intramembrane metalloprotease [Oscillospiraceae bacterium]
MAAKAASSPMTALERTLGGVFFSMYLLVLPFAADALFAGLCRLLGRDLPDNVRNMIFYYTLFALTLVIFWHYLGHTTSYFLSNFWKTLAAVCTGMVGFYGLNEISYRVLDLILGRITNLNDIAISAQIHDAPRSTLLIIIFLAPFVEEVLFRGYIFGNLRATSRTAAYIVSCLLFAFLHVWQFAVIHRDLSYFLLMLQYLVPGLAFAWTYERSGTLWGSVLLHAAVNALAAWSVL